MRNVMALMIVALSMAILVGQAAADGTASTARGSGEVIIQPDGTITITVTRPITSGSCIPVARLKVRLHPNGRWINQGKGHRNEKDNSYVWTWDWITFPYYRDGIYDWHVDISCDLGIEEGVVIVDNSDIDYPDYGDFPRSPAPPKEDDDPDDGSGGSGSTGGGWSDAGGGYTWDSGGTGDASGGTSGNGGGATTGGGNSTGGATGSTGGNSGSTGGRRNGYGTAPLAYGTPSEESDVSIKAEGDDGVGASPLVLVQDQHNGHLIISVTRHFPTGGSGSCNPQATLKVRLQPDDWINLGVGVRTPSGDGGYTWTWDWMTCDRDNGTYDTWIDITCNPIEGTPDIGTATVANPVVDLQADKTTIMTGGVDNDVHKCTITATVTNATTGYVTFSIVGSTGHSTAASLSATSVALDENGHAQTILTSSDEFEDVTVRASFGYCPATAEKVIEQAKGDFTQFLIDPAELIADGESTAQISYTLVQDQTTTVVPGHQMLFVIDSVLDADGNAVDPSNWAEYGSITGSGSTTDSNGLATGEFTAGTSPGIVYIKAEDHNVWMP